MTRPPADPEDTGAVLAHYATLAREGRPDLSPLLDRSRWNDTPAPVQDICARVVASRLGAAWGFVEMRRYECRIGFVCALEGCGNRRLWVRFPAPCSPECAGCQKGPSPGTRCTACHSPATAMTIAHRLAVFVHRATRAEFVMCPGRWPDRARTYPLPLPLLVARWPLTIDYLMTIYPLFAPAVDFVRSGPDLPVTGLSHQSARDILDKVGLRLPTAAEWEHFARAGSTTRYYWGEEMDHSHCWHRENSGRDHECGVCEAAGRPCNVNAWAPRPHAPAEHDRAGKWNAFGLVDVWGNIGEIFAEHDAFDGITRFCGGGFNVRPDQVGDGRIDFVRGSAPTVGFRPVADIPGLVMP